MTGSKSQPRLKHKVKPRSKLNPVGPALAGVLALLTAIVGLIPQLPNISKWVKRQISSGPYKVFEPVSSPKVIPSYLTGYYEDEGLGAPEKLYWFRSNVTNKTGGELALEITFKLDSAHCEFVSINQSDNPKRVEVEAGKKVPTNFSPPLHFSNDNTTDSCSLLLHYDIGDDAGDTPYHNFAKITLLPPQQVEWDLKNVDAGSVSKDFLLASLTAWSLSKEGKVLERGGDLRRRAHTVSPDWLRLCYEILFQGQSSTKADKTNGIIFIDPTQNTYPFNVEKTVRYPGEIISVGRAEPLEGAFLMASIINAAATPGHIPMSLFVLPQAQDINHPAVLLGTPLPNNNWEIIDLRKANFLGFQQNLEQSQQELQQALSQNTQMLQSLQDKGVFMTEEMNLPKAISFNRARVVYRTLGLPFASNPTNK
jgi:hypothetical protein